MQEDMMGRTFSKHGEDKKWLQNFSRKTWREETTSETSEWMGGWYQSRH